MALTAEAVRKLKATDIRQEIADKGGLYLVIQPSGVKSWAFRGRVKGETKKITLGRFPDVDLVAARDLAGDARKAAHAGVLFAPPPQPPRTQMPLQRHRRAARLVRFGSSIARSAWSPNAVRRRSPSMRAYSLPISSPYSARGT